MKIEQVIISEVKQRLDPKCWTGKHKEGTKIKGGVRVNNCVPNESIEEAALPWDGKAVVVYDATGAKILDTLDINTAAQKYGLNPLDIKNQLKVQSYTTMKGPKGSFIVSQPMAPTALDAKPGFTEDWNKVNKKDKTDGMSRKAVKAYRRENPGSKLKTAVTTKPSKLKKGGKAASRRKSFCARMGGMKKHRAGAKTKRDPNSPINKALRRWNCESIEELKQLAMIAEQKINEAKNWKQQAAIAIHKKEDLKEFAPSDNGDGPDEEELLKRLATQWWLGSEQDMIRAERTLASMGWEIGEDEGYDEGGVFVVRAGDVNGKSYTSWSHDDLAMNEQGVAEESKGLWANIHAKRERIKHGSGERMRKPGSKGAPTASALKKSATEGKGDYVPPKEADYGYEYQQMVKRVGQKAKQQELAKKKQQEQPKDLDESTTELNKILKLSGHTK